MGEVFHYICHTWTHWHNPGNQELCTDYDEDDTRWCGMIMMMQQPDYIYWVGHLAKSVRKLIDQKTYENLASKHKTEKLQPLQDQEG